MTDPEDDPRYQLCKVCGAKDCDCTLNDLIDHQSKEIAALNTLTKKMADALEDVLAAHRLTLKRPADTMEKIENELQTIRSAAAKAEAVLTDYRTKQVASPGV